MCNIIIIAFEGDFSASDWLSHLAQYTIEYTADYSKQNGTNFRFIGWRVAKL